MTIDEMRHHEWVVSWSGGKDSTATIILMHEHRIPIKKIIYVRMMFDDDLPATLPLMTDFVDRAKGVFEKWGYDVEIVRSNKTAMDLAKARYQRSKKTERNGKPYGMTAFCRGMCKFTQVKVNTIKQLHSVDEWEMIGYASDEVTRIHRLGGQKQSIMVALDVKEKDTFEICKRYDLLSPLYDTGIGRDGCFFCPNAGKAERERLRSKHPELVDKINDLIEMCGYDLSHIKSRNHWVNEYKGRNEDDDMKTIIYDFEVTAFDWIVVFRDIESEDHTVFHNDYDEIHAFINKVKKDLLVGFNNKHYDDYILKAIYHRATPEKVKELNDFIIVKGRQGWEFPFLKYKKKVFQTADLRDDIADKGLSLKAIEGNLNLPIVESSVPFDIDRPLTEDEVKEMIFYCKKDVDATVMLCKERSEYLQSKKLVGSMFGIDEREAVGLTNAKLSAKVLGATKTDYWDERDYHIPAVIRKDRIPHKILGFFLEIHNDMIRDDDLFATSLNVVIRTQAGDCPCSYAWGGVHGAKPCYIAEATDEDLIVNYDVASLYPNSMINFGYTSRSMSDPDAYKNIVKTRIGYKHAGDKDKANALKLIINTTYGAMLNEYNDLNDPKSGRSVCITNQLAMTDLIVGLAESVKSFDMINFNTDGVMFHLKKSEEVKAQAIIDEWCDRVGFELERDDIQKIIQKDVNNYICIKKDGKVKSKGGYVNIVDGGSFKMNTLRVVQKAIVDYFVKGSDPETTVKEDEDIFDFQMIAKTGSTYTGCVHEIAGELVEVNKVNRVYASHDETLGTLYKIKRKDGKIIKKDKVASLPEHCLTDNENEHTRSEIDDQFYIDLAKSRIKDFKVPKRKVLKDIEKMEVIEIMPRKATTKAEETTTAKAPEEVKIDLKEMNVYHRLNKARIDFLNTPISKSGDNKFAKFKYFELDDIIPVALPILDKYGLCYHITFASDHATALLINTDDPEDLIEFKTPITELDVRAKGMNSNQALGAQETYARRRLWISMLELVENDTLDAISGDPNNVEVEKTEDAKDESNDTDENDEEYDFMNIPEDVEEEVEMLTSKTTTAIKKALKEYRDNGGDEVYIKDCLKKMKRADFFEPHGQKMLVEITEKLS